MKQQGGGGAGRGGGWATVVPQNMSLLSTSMEEVVELKAHLQHTHWRVTRDSDTHAPPPQHAAANARTHQKMLGSISACPAYLPGVGGGRGERQRYNEEQVVAHTRQAAAAPDLSSSDFFTPLYTVVFTFGSLLMAERRRRRAGKKAWTRRARLRSRSSVLSRL